MSTGIMRQTVTVLSVVWILWSYYFSAVDGRTKWAPMQGFETREACVSTAKKTTSDSNVVGIPMLQGEEGDMSFHCFPSDFNPRG